MKVVFDTNVLFAAFVSRSGVCVRIVEAALAEHEVLLSPHILNELRRNLAGKLDIEESKIEAAIQSLVDVAKLIEPVPLSPDVSREEQDAPVLGTALAGDAGVLVTGDKDLLELRNFGSIAIISPRDCHDRYVGTER